MNLLRISLSPFQIKAIHKAIDILFDRARVRVLGPQSVDKRIYGAGHDEKLSIPGIFRAASYEEYNKPDIAILHTLMENVGNYIESYRSATKAEVVKKVDTFLAEAATRGIKTDLATVLGGQLADVWKKTTNDMHRLIDTEAQNARAVGALDGIIKVNASQGIEDPVVCWVVVRDGKCCYECMRLHMMPDGITPRLWYLSEVKSGYAKRGDEVPSLSEQHPHGRCSIVTMMPSYGFDAKGFITFKKLGYNAIEEQRKTEKSEISHDLHDGSHHE
jgi:hypothetical protein